MRDLIRSRVGDAPTAEAADDDLVMKRQVELNDFAALIAEAERDPRPLDVGSHERAQDYERHLSE